MKNWNTRGSRIVRIMKISLRLFIIQSLFLSWVLASENEGQSLDHTLVHLQLSDVELQYALNKLEEVTPYRFIYSTDELDVERKVNVNARESSMRDVLTFLFDGTNTTIKQYGKYLSIHATTGKTELPPPVGGIKGKVIDSSTSETLIGATVTLVSTSFGTITDKNGEFEFKNISVGEYTLEISYVGYTKKQITGINVTAGNYAIIDISLETSTVGIDEAKVVANINVRTAPIINSTEISMIESIRSAELAVTGISHEQIAKSLDRDASEVMRRVTGVTMFDNFVLIRGLNPRYTVVQVNGLPAPSSEADQRSFNFNLVPSGIIDQVMTYKAPAAELPGGFAGGVVKIKTKSTNIARRFNIGVSGQFRTGGSSFSDYRTYEGSNLDWLAWGMEDRKWGNENLYDHNLRFPDFNSYPQENVDLIKGMKIHSVKNGHHNFDKRVNLEYYDSWRIGSVRLNNLTSASYSNTRKFTIVDYKLGPAYLMDENNVPYLAGVDLSYTDSVYSESVRLNALQSFSLIINENNRISFDNILNRLGHDKVLDRQGIDEDHGQQEKYFELEYKLKDYYTGQISGDHQIGNLSVGWRAGYNYISEFAPNTNRFYFTRGVDDTGDWRLQFSKWAPDSPNRSFTEETKENGYSGALDLNYKVNENVKVLTGVYFVNNERNLLVQGFNFAKAQNAQLDDIYAPAPWESIDTLFTEEYFRADGTGYIVNKFGTEQFASYTFKDYNKAAYLALQYKLLNQKLSLYAGVRYEANTREYYDLNGKKHDGTLSDEGNRLSPPGIDTVYWLPSVNLSYRIFPRQTLRLSYGKTIDKPDYREQADFRYINWEEHYNVKGNPYLKIATIDNYDFRWEFYPGDAEFIAIGAFYKYFRDPIETYDKSQGGHVAAEITYDNSVYAEVYGTEVEIRKSLGFITRYLNDFSVIANVALIESNTKTKKKTWYGGGDYTAGLAQENRPMIGASPYVINGGLYYDNSKTHTQFSLLYNVIGPRLMVAAGISVPPQYELERHVLDLTFSQQISKHIHIKAGVQDLLNQKVRFFRDADLSGDYNPVTPKAIEELWGNKLLTDYIETEYKPGSYYSLGVVMKF